MTGKTARAVKAAESSNIHNQQKDREQRARGLNLEQHVL
jgi:hypothetical protein